MELLIQVGHVHRQEEKQFSPAYGKTRLGMDILRMSDCGKAVKNIGEAVD